MKRSVLIISLLTGLRAAAQHCTGGLGDPIVDITFGQGIGPGPALASGITNMTYQTASCPEDGYYTIASQTSNCYSGSWWNVPQDHTGNPNGYFMLVNASYQPSDFYVQTVNGLCAGTNYQFAAWILNLVTRPGEILPNITFTIEKTDGTVLQTFGTGDIPETTGGPAWVQYAFYFNTPPGISSVVLRMTNNAPGGIGNDLCLDDITFRAAGPTIQASITGYPTDTVGVCANVQPILSLGATVESCYPSQVEQWQQSLDSGGTWTDISGATGNSWSRAPSVPGNYTYRLAVAQSGNLGDSACQVVSAPISVAILTVPTPGVTIADTSSGVCANAPVSFTATPAGGGPSPAYQWTVNGAPAGMGGAVLTTSFGAGPQTVACTMTSDDVCAVNPVAQSNTLSLSVIPIPVTGVSIGATATQICQDSVVTFTATPFNGGPAPAFQWQVNGVNAGAAGPSAVFPDGGLQNGDVVNCIMTGSLTCSLPVSAAAPIAMTIYPLPVIVLDSSTIIAGGSSVELRPVISGNIGSVAWTPAGGLSDAWVATPVATPAVTTAYHLNVVTEEGCKASATEVVKVFYDLKMPAAFTPNGDGHNDVFRVPPSVPVSVRRFAVYNRQGAMLFYTENVAAGWDGTFNGQPQPAGVYVWMIEYEDPVTKMMEAKKGTVVLVR